MDISKPKKEWTTPVLVVYGEVEKLTTKMKGKGIGGSDGVTLKVPHEFSLLCSG